MPTNTRADLAGQKFGLLTPLTPEKRGAVYGWICRCECGTEKWVAENNLRSGCTKSCGCKSKRPRLSTEEWVTRAVAKHGDRYDYTKAVFAGSSTKVTIGCRLHGWFEQLPYDHVYGSNCPKCVIEASAKSKQKDTEWFVSRAKELYGDRYDYSSTEYTSATDYCTIICKEHGQFTLKASEHVNNNRGCPKCGAARRGQIKKEKTGWIMDNAKMNAIAKEIHGDTITVISEQCDGTKTQIKAECALHGPFTRAAGELLNKHRKKGCQTCGDLSGARKRTKITTASLVAKAIEANGDFYDYSKVQYSGRDNDVTVICKEHGPFQMNPLTIWSGRGTCPTCAYMRRRKTTDWFIVEAIKVHGDRYDYSEVKYTHAHGEVTIVCKQHGGYNVKAYRHLSGNGKCPKCCSGGTSSLEKELGSFLSSLELPVETRTRKIITPYELDFYFPSKKLAVEFCGLYWHSEALLPKNYHSDKLRMAKDKGVRLIQLFEDEWLYKEKLVCGMLTRMLVGGLETLGARRCEAVFVSGAEARKFYLENHLSGFASAQEHIALMFGGSPVAMASFSGKRAIYGGKEEPDRKELVRFCTALNLKVYGGLEKLIAFYFSERTEVNRIVSYVDRRWFTGKTYVDAGFTLLGQTPTGYYYVKGQKRYSRFYFPKHKLKERLEKYDPILTEKENMLNNGYLRIYDCGNLKYEITRK